MLGVLVFMVSGLITRHDSPESLNIKGDVLNLEADVEMGDETNGTVLEERMNSEFETATFALG